MDYNFDFNKNDDTYIEERLVVPRGENEKYVQFGDYKKLYLNKTLPIKKRLEIIRENLEQQSQQDYN